MKNDYLNDVPKRKEKNILLIMLYLISFGLIEFWFLASFFFFGVLWFIFPVLQFWWVPVLVIAAKFFAVICIISKNKFAYMSNIILITVILVFWAYIIIAEGFFNIFIAAAIILEIALLVLVVLGRKYYSKVLK